jgi:uncharacterized membrane protein
VVGAASQETLPANCLDIQDQGTNNREIAADFLFTATAVVAQPLTGVALAWHLGYSLTDGWIVLSVLLYTLSWIVPIGWAEAIGHAHDFE